MAKKVWIGGATEDPQVDLATLPSDIESGQKLRATIGPRNLLYPFPDGPLKLEVVAEFVERWNASDIPEFDEISAVDNGDGSFNLIADDGIGPFIVAFRIGDGTNEIQVITIGNNPTGGTFTLDFDGQITAPIDHDATAAALKAALELLSNIAVDDIAVTGDPGGPWTIEFIGNLADMDVALLKGDTTNLEGTNEIQVVNLVSAAGGTFTAEVDGQVTGPVAFDATAATFQTALEGLSSVGAGNVSVAGGNGGPYTVTFQNALGKTNVENIIIDGTNLTGFVDASIVETTPGSGGSNERHVIQSHLVDGSDQNGRLLFSGDASVTAGTWDLTISSGIENIITLSDIPWNVTFSELQELIDAESVAWGLNAKYRFFFAHIFATNPVGNEKLSDGDNAYMQVDAASGLYSLAITIDNTGLTGGTFTGSVSNTLYFGDSLDYGSGSGSWKFIIDGDSTDDLSPTITGDALKIAIEGLSAVGTGNVSVFEIGEGQGFNFGGGFIIEFIGDLGNQVTGFAITTSKSAGSTLNLEVWTGYTGDSGIGEVQTLSISGSPVSGTFALSYLEKKTALLNFDDTAAEIQTALEGLPSIGVGNVLCSGGPLPDTPVVITFAGPLAGIDLEEIKVIKGVVTESVEGGNAPTLDVVTTQTKMGHVTTTPHQGPNDFNTPANWDTNSLPEDSDDLDFYDGTDVLFGLDQSAKTYGRVQTYERGPRIGLPRRNASYFEYRDRSLKLNADEIVLESASDRTNIDIMTSSPKIEVRESGAGQDGELAVQIVGVNAVNTAELLILDGEVAIAYHPKEEAYFKKITQRDGDLSLGSGVSCAELIKSDGDIKSDRFELIGQTTL